MRSPKTRGIASAAVLSLFGAASGHAESLGDLFKEGIFGLAWGSSNAAVESKMPSGRWRGSDAYIVRNSTTVLGVERKQREVIFNFANGEMTSVTTRFQGGLSTFHRLRDHALLAFGTYTHPENVGRVGKDGSVRDALRWLPDDGVSIYLVCELEGMQPDCDLTISYVWPLRPTTLSDIGLN